LGSQATHAFYFAGVAQPTALKTTSARCDAVTPHLQGKGLVIVRSCVGVSVIVNIVTIFLFFGLIH
jgi:hypothetical protein